MSGLHFMFALLALAAASDLSAWNGETNQDMNTLSLIRPLNGSQQLGCPSCVLPWMRVPKGCPDVPLCLRHRVCSLKEENQAGFEEQLTSNWFACPDCKAEWYTQLPPGCPQVPVCPKVCPKCVYKIGLPPPGCLPVPLCPLPTRRNEANYGWRAASLDA